MRDIRENGVSEAELTRAKRVYEARWVRRLEDMEGQANYLAEWEALGDWELGDDYLRRALAVTTDDIQALARRFLDPDQAGVIVYRPKDGAEMAADAASMRSLLDGAPAARVEPIAASPLVVPAPRHRGCAPSRRKAACTSSARRRGSRCSCAGRRAR